MTGPLPPLPPPAPPPPQPSGTSAGVPEPHDSRHQVRQLAASISGPEGQCGGGGGGLALEKDLAMGKPLWGRRPLATAV